MIGIQFRLSEEYYKNGGDDSKIARVFNKYGFSRELLGFFYSDKANPVTGVLLAQELMLDPNFKQNVALFKMHQISETNSLSAIILNI